ncbi:hypothetical protein SAMD00019534_022290 [Acytostelium subglobosum LB1]|uniref:hypothetical protein n=1 Tax=Acytostelium subglobosum LB1 TaxID=1410327 RepID=UPI000644D087|nr:hypothetical protein SAMD00019534_022290 [Acytostelium subglobosum LB1]GAM19054.1 hypothetical protein SAMD00019534_022290 [Acytostelium subglobosum LB1]|eukprot:XP_012756981.1 hypothetical protein SAMD00019534_022290 [Acytostelium subglobosum LB1]
MTISKVVLGICAMEEKIESAPMRVFIKKLMRFEDLNVILFDRNTIFSSPIEEWPVCNAFLCFYSTGFPLEKAIKYSELRKPFEINNLKAQRLLKNRKSFNQILEQNSIPAPRKIYIERGDTATPTRYIEHEDYVEADGVRIYKPFVEKPFDAEDHNINIYYPMSQGGGCRRLFRKVENNSSSFHPDVNNIRTDGSYIYEEFVKLDDAKDVKVYSMPINSYAELRKSPSVDGTVERNSSGKERRIETKLTDYESRIASIVNREFKQFICGFDILRTNGVSYVCDVNGWSMVKGRHQDAFYEEASLCLRDMLLPDRGVWDQVTASDTTYFSIKQQQPSFHQLSFNHEITN